MQCLTVGQDRFWKRNKCVPLVQKKSTCSLWVLNKKKKKRSGRMTSMVAQSSIAVQRKVQGGIVRLKLRLFGS